MIIMMKQSTVEQKQNDNRFDSLSIKIQYKTKFNDDDNDDFQIIRHTQTKKHEMMIFVIVNILFYVTIIGYGDYQ